MGNQTQLPLYENNRQIGCILATDENDVLISWGAVNANNFDHKLVIKKKMYETRNQYMQQGVLVGMVLVCTKNKTIKDKYYQFEFFARAGKYMTVYGVFKELDLSTLINV